MTALPVREQLRACAAAFTFLTRLPLGRIVAHGVDDLGSSLVYFPVVGIVIGLAGGAMFAVASALWPPVLALIISTGFTVLLTGAFHEDALADAFDGFGGGWNRARILEIMKDSRVGSYALVGMVLAIGAKLAALLAVFDAAASAHNAALTMTRALVAGHTVGRWSSVALIAWLPYVRPDVDESRPATGRSFALAASRGKLAAATTIAGLVVAIAAGWRGASIAVVTLAILWVAARYLRARIGGITGDALGAVNQIVELSTYLVLAARL